MQTNHNSYEFFVLINYARLHWCGALSTRERQIFELECQYRTIANVMQRLSSKALTGEGVGKNVSMYMPRASLLVRSLFSGQFLRASLLFSLALN